MRLSRRDFMHAGCVAGMVSLAPHFLDYARAGINNPGSGPFSPPSQLVGQSVINAGSSNLGFINLLHGYNPICSKANFPNDLNSDGYPTGTLTNSITAPVSVDPTYYGRYKLWWAGTGCIQLQPWPTIVYSGGANVTGVNPSAAGSVAFNFTTGLTGQPTQASPVEFAFGFLITAVSTSGDGLVQFTGATNVISQLSGGEKFVFNNITSGLPAGPNFDGSWTIAKIDAQNIKLVGSTAYAGSVVITGVTGAGTQSEGILSTSTMTINFLTAGTYSGFSSAICCKSADVTAVIAGQLASPVYVTQFRNMNPRWIRVMDYTAVQSDRSSSFTYRTKTTNLGWGAFHLVPDYYVGAVTNGGSDAYTCSNPIGSPASGPPVDGEQVIGQLSGANTGVNPTLAVSRSGFGTAPPIMSTTLNAGASQSNLFLTGSVPAAGKIVTFNFSAAGLGSPYSPTYTVLAGDTTLTILGQSLVAKFRADATLLAAGIVCPFNGGSNGSSLSFQFNPNIGGLGASKLVVSASDNGAPGATYTFGTTNIGSLVNNAYTTFAYSALIGAWFCVQGLSDRDVGIHGGAPLEFYADLCNRAGVGLWTNVGIMWDANRITQTVTTLANLGVKELVLELQNETWNAFEAEWAASTTMGCCLGLKNTGNSVSSANGFTGLRSLQISQLAAAAWVAAGRSRSQFYMSIDYQFDSMTAAGTGDTCQNRMLGANLDTSTNATLASFGGMGQAALTPNPSVAGNRPVDNADLIGGAPYFAGGQLNGGNGGTTLSTGVPLASYNGLLLASYNYVNGNSTQQSAALDFLYNSGANTGDLYNGTLNGTRNNDFQLSGFEIGSGFSAAGYFGIGSFAANLTGAAGSYDTFRTGTLGKAVLGCANYEGWLFCAPVTAGEITGFTGSLTTLGDVSGYTSSLGGAAAGPTSTAATDAANMATLLAAWKLDARCAALTTKYLQGFKTAANTVANRIACNAVFGFEGPTVWSIYTSKVGTITQPTQAVAALQAFDN